MPRKVRRTTRRAGPLRPPAQRSPRWSGPPCAARAGGRCNRRRQQLGRLDVLCPCVLESDRPRDPEERRRQQDDRRRTSPGPAVAEHRGDRDGEDHGWQRHQCVVHPVGHESKTRPRNTEARPVVAPMTSATSDGLERAQHRQPGAGHQPAEHVAAEVVGAQQVTRAGPAQRVGDVLVHGVVRREQRRRRRPAARRPPAAPGRSRRRKPDDAAEQGHYRLSAGRSQPRSALTRTLETMTSVLVTSRTPCTTGTSREVAESLAKLTQTRQPKTSSVTTAPPTRTGKPTPRTVSAGPLRCAGHARTGCVAGQAAHQRSGDVVLLVHVDERRAQLTGDGVPGSMDSATAGSTMCLAQPRPGRRSARHSRSRAAAPADREQHDQPDADHERRHRREGRAEPGHGTVDPGAPAQGRQGAVLDPDQHAEHQREAGQRQVDRQPLGDSWSRVGAVGPVRARGRPAAPGRASGSTAPVTGWSSPSTWSICAMSCGVALSPSWTPPGWRSTARAGRT